MMYYLYIHIYTCVLILGSIYIYTLKNCVYIYDYMCICKYMYQWYHHDISVSPQFSLKTVVSSCASS